MLLLTYVSIFFYLYDNVIATRFNSFEKIFLHITLCAAHAFYHIAHSLCLRIIANIVRNVKLICL